MSSSELFLAATRPKAARPLRTLPEKLKVGLQAQLEGIMVPGNRKEYLDAVAGISENVFPDEIPGMPEKYDKDIIGINGAVDFSKRRLQAVARLLRLADSDDYLKFLARPGFRLATFEKMAATFNTDRAIVFTDVPPDVTEKAERICALAKEDSDHALRGIAGILKEYLSRDAEESFERASAIWTAYESAAFLSGNIERAASLVRKSHPRVYSSQKRLFEDQEFVSPLLQQELVPEYLKFVVKPLLLEHGIYTHLDKRKYLRFSKRSDICMMRGYVLSHPEEIFKKDTLAITLGWDMLFRRDEEQHAQHELQHAFDNLISVDGGSTDREYRATLAELAFCRNKWPTLNMLMEVPEQILLVAILGAKPNSKPHFDAKARAWRELAHVNPDMSGMIDVVASPNPPLRNLEPGNAGAHAMDLLNKAYKKACGLTYDEILRPFRR